MSKAWVGCIDGEDGRHRIDPAVDEVFGDGVAPDVAARIFPLLSVDLGELHPELADGTRVHFLYTELEQLHFRSERGLYHAVDDYASVMAFYRGQEAAAPVRSWRGRSVSFHEIEVPERADDEDDFDFADRLEDVAMAQVAGAKLIRIGGPPLWVQSPRVPTTPDGEPMRFIGQIVASELTRSAARATLYLFHDPVSGLVTQVSQFG